jgi:dihydropteroate synthase
VSQWLGMALVQIIGVLNITPDSFYDGGKFLPAAKAIAKAEELIADGADIIEIGGESTGPESPNVSVDEEINRTIPVIKEIRNKWPKKQISIDTYKNEVALAALDAGASMVNDVTAGRGDPRLFAALSPTQVPCVLMYSKDHSPRTTVAPVQYKDIVQESMDFLRRQIDDARHSGISKDRIIIDPGLGHFISSDAQYSFQIVAHVQSSSALLANHFLQAQRSFRHLSVFLAPLPRRPLPYFMVHTTSVRTMC